MCSHFHAPEPRQLAIAFGTQPEGDYVTDLWPGYTGAFVRRHPHADAQDDAVPRYDVSAGTFGLLPFWAKSATLARSTYNARSETAAEKPSFRNAWKKASGASSQHNAFSSLTGVPERLSQRESPARTESSWGLLDSGSGGVQRIH